MTASVCLAASVAAQSTPRREFTRQALLVAPFRSDSTAASLAAARQVADALRKQLDQQLDGPELQVLGHYLLGNALAESDYRRDAVLGEVELRLVAGKLRADEIVFGRVTLSRGEITVAPRMARLRNWTMQQPLPVVRAPTVGQAAAFVAIEVARARAQLAGTRRCENALLRSDRRTAVREAEGAIRSYPRAVIARDCLLAALADGRTTADSLLVVAEAALAIDTANTFAAVARARSLEALQRPGEAVRQWRQLLAWHPDSLDLGQTGVEALLRLQEPTAALELARAYETRFGPDAAMRRLRFRAAVARAAWPTAAPLGDSLDHEDATFREDSSYAIRYVEALRQVGDTLAALEVAVRSIRRFPGDSRLYLQYLQLLGAEQPAALPRGLGRFPEVPELHLLAAQAARRSGDRQTAIRALRDAIRRDPRRVAAYLQLADLFADLPLPDSTLAVLRRAPRDGESGESVRAYVLARGLLAVRGVADSAPPAHALGVGLLQLADSIASREDSRAMVTAALLQQARAHLVVAGRTRGCRDLRVADEALGQVTQRLEQGTGPTAGELMTAYRSMRQAVDDAARVLCGTAHADRAPGRRSNAAVASYGRTV